MDSPATGPACTDAVCITCSDELVPLTVRWVSGDGATAGAVSEGRQVEISVELIDGVRTGDVVLVHGGVALQRAVEDGR